MSDEMPSVREALTKAFAEAPADEAPEPVVDHDPPADDAQEPVADDAQEPVTDGRERDEFGRFKPKATPDPDPQPVQEPIDAAPEWLNHKGVRAEWGKLPAPVREHLTARFGEMERGIAQYREQLAPYQPFLERAKASGVDPVALVGRYVEIDSAFTQNPMQGFEMIARSFGTDMRTIAAHVLGREAPPRDAQVAQLQQELATSQRELQQLRGLAQQVRAERATKSETLVSEFAKTHPRFEELAEVMQEFIPSFKRLAPEKALEAAYRLAEQAFPAPAAAQPLAPAAAPQGQGARTAGPVSIKGAPSAGSNPARKPEVMSSRDAVRQAFAQVGTR